MVREEGEAGIAGGDDYLRRYGTARNPFTPRDVRYLNWRLVLDNGSGRGRPTIPIIDTFALAYRLEDR